MQLREARLRRMPPAVPFANKPAAGVELVEWRTGIATYANGEFPGFGGWCEFFGAWVMGVAFASVWCLVLITYERRGAILHPFKRRGDIGLRRRLRAGYAACWVGGALLHCAGRLAPGRSALLPGAAPCPAACREDSAVSIMAWIRELESSMSSEESKPW